MASGYKTCPICNTPNHRNAAVCTTCGATLSNIAPSTAGAGANVRSSTDYNFQFGETDLSEKYLQWRGGSYLLGGILILVSLICVGELLLAGISLFNRLVNVSPAATILPGSLAPAPTLNSGPIIATNTPRPTLFLATVTPAPATATYTQTPTATPTQGPCAQQVQPNDDLYAIVYRCGYRNYETIINEVIALNNLADPAQIQPGQVILVPWPTPTPDPNAAPATAPAEDNAESAIGLANSPENSAAAAAGAPAPTETLQTGVMWHRVVRNENILAIAYNYGANLKILSELNPEVTFSQCDFGLGSGGPNCIVQLYEGQLIRVPAPTPTPTLSPTFSGSETPTPSATPTFNAPSLLSPGDRAFFRSDELVTLRWVATGSLGPDQAYLVQVEDQTAGLKFSTLTRDLAFIVPEAWHNQDAIRHDFIWAISVIDVQNPDQPYFTTEPRRFTWQGRGGR